MFVREHQNQFRTAQADIKQFYAGFGRSTNTSTYSWTKPTGVSFIYFLLAGAGAPCPNVSTYGGGSGATTVWFGNANIVPNVLQIKFTSASTSVIYQTSASGGTTILSANAGSTTSGGTTTAATSFGNSGFYSSVAGQDGTPLAQTVNISSFLQGGADGYTYGAPGNYGYNGGSNGGVFSLSPILVSTSSYVSGATAGNPAPGSGASYPNTAYTSPGFVIIASW